MGALFVFMAMSIVLRAQVEDTTSILNLKNVKFNAYLEMYAAADDPFSKSHERPSFLYNNTRTNELALNLGLVKVSWTDNKTRCNLAMMTGSYASRNLSAEPKVFQHVYEANVGLKLSTKKDIWLDMGIINSHLGMESAIGIDNPTLTRSMAAENSPYYETGLKLSTKSKNEKWNLNFLVLNGWQRIYMPTGNYSPSFGMQITFKPTESLLINYSNYLGDENPTKDFGLRFFNDLYVIYNPSRTLSLMGAFDVGVQGELNDNNIANNNWYSWFGVVRYRIIEKLFVAARMEQFSDEQEIIVNNFWNKGFNTFAYSLNFDYAIYENVLLRVEARHFEGKSNTFESGNGMGRSNYSGLTSSLSIAF